MSSLARNDVVVTWSRLSNEGATQLGFLNEQRSLSKSQFYLRVCIFLSSCCWVRWYACLKVFQNRCASFGSCLAQIVVISSAFLLSGCCHYTDSCCRIPLGRPSAGHSHLHGSFGGIRSAGSENVKLWIARESNAF